MPEAWVFWVAIPAVLLSGISKGGFGSGVSFASAAILALVVEPTLALALMLPVLMVIDVASLKPYWGKWHRPSAQVLILGGIPGTVLGAALFRVVEADTIRVLIGAIALAFPLYQLARARGWLSTAPRPFNATYGVAMGIIAGFTSFVSHAGGPPVAVFMLPQKEIGKTAYQATTVIIFWVLNAVKCGFYAALGIFTLQSLTTSAALVPVALVGTWLGVRAHDYIPERAFFAVTYLLLLLTGARLLWVGLT